MMTMMALVLDHMMSYTFIFLATSHVKLVMRTVWVTITIMVMMKRATMILMMSSGLTIYTVAMMMAMRCL